MELEGGNMKTNYLRKSIVAPYIDELLQDKRANGYTYACAELILNRFDSYCTKNGLTTLEISKDFLSEWMEQKETEGAHNHGKRISCVRQLLLFMATCGIHVYIPHDFCHFTRPLPHIFTSEEVIAFFYEVDHFCLKHPNKNAQRLGQEYRLLFRLYYCCGLRNSEAARIAVEHVDLQLGILTIINAKGQKDRLVYLSEDLLISCQNYYRWISQKLGVISKWFFPGLVPDKPLINSTVDSVFNRYWNRTKYANCNNKPTVHDFRFSFVVQRMNLWAQADIDLKVMLPYLSRYLGHKSINETFYYYYLVNDAYKTIEKKDTIALNVIPEVQAYEY